MADETNDKEKEVESGLIDQVRERKLLYDKRVDAYRSRKARANAWESIGLAMGMTGKECQRVWNSLRSQYMAHRRKLKNPSGSAAGTRPYFRYEHAMMFLGEALGEETTFSNIPESNENDQPADGDNENENEEGEKDETSEVAAVLVPRHSANEVENRVHAKFGGQKRKLDSFDEELLNYIKSDDVDEFESFGKVVGAKLRKINESNKKICSTLQKQINNLLLDAEIELA